MTAKTAKQLLEARGGEIVGEKATLRSTGENCWIGGYGQLCGISHNEHLCDSKAFRHISAETLDALLAAAYADADEQARSEVSWQPMETAPKDETAVLVMLHQSRLPVVARFSAGCWEVAWDRHALNDLDGPRCWMPLAALGKETNGNKS